MEMRLRAPVTRSYFFLLGALRLVNAASPRNIDQKKISSGTQGIRPVDRKGYGSIAHEAKPGNKKMQVEVMFIWGKKTKENPAILATR